MDEWSYTQGSHKNETIKGKLEVVLVEDNMRETCLRWFGHVQRRPIDTTVRTIGRSDFRDISIRGGRPKKSWIETAINDLNVHNLTNTVAQNQKDLTCS